MIHKEKKRVALIIIAIILFLVVVAMAIFLFTKKVNDSPFILGDSYPANVKYIGIRYDIENQNVVIVPMDENFLETNYKIDTFYFPKTITNINGRILIYSDAINEVAYKKDEDRFYLNEINSFYDNSANVYLTKNYMIFQKEDGTLSFELYSSREITEISDKYKNLIALYNDTIYYTLDNNIISYDLNNNKKEIILTDSNPVIENYNDNFILLSTSVGYKVYNFSDKSLKALDNLTSEVSNVLALYEDGVIYARFEPYKLVSYNINSNKYEVTPYEVETDYAVDNMYYISDGISFIDFVNSNEDHLYYLFNLKTNEIIKTFNQNYERIIKVG